MEWKHIFMDLWVGEKDGKYYMKDYIHRPFSKMKRIREITRKEFERYSKYIID